MAYTLNPDATVTLDSGEIVAVSVSRERLANGAGIAFTAKAIWVDVGGTAHTDGAGEVNSETTFSADLPSVDAHGEDALAKELLLAVLGEPPSSQAAMFSGEYRASVNIRNHIAAASAPQLNASMLLG